jgi:hypothetical protein
MLLFMEFVTVFVLGVAAGVACVATIIIDKDDDEAPWWSRMRR